MTSEHILIAASTAHSTLIAITSLFLVLGDLVLNWQFRVCLGEEGFVVNQPFIFRVCLKGEGSYSLSSILVLLVSYSVIGELLS
jgi:hypothetical protein